MPGEADIHVMLDECPLKVLSSAQADKSAGLAREAALLEGKCQLKAALSSALESKAEVEGALQIALLDQQRLQQEVFKHCALCKHFAKRHLY